MARYLEVRLGMDERNCCGHSQDSPRESERIATLQSRIDDLLAGRPQVDIKPTSENERLFSAFSSEDKSRAQAIAALCSKIARRIDGIAGIEAAVQKLYDTLPNTPLGMVEHATKLFLTHYAPAREILQIRSLEERQPGMVKPSRPAHITQPV